MSQPSAVGTWSKRACRYRNRTGCVETKGKRCVRRSDAERLEVDDVGGVERPGDRQDERLPLLHGGWNANLPERVPQAAARVCGAVHAQLAFLAIADVLGEHGVQGLGVGVETIEPLKAEREFRGAQDAVAVVMMRDRRSRAHEPRRTMTIVGT